MRPTHPNLDKVVAISCSDLHLSSKAPVARPQENWMECQVLQLQELSTLVDSYHVPLILAGDIFDRSSMNAEIVNLAIKYLHSCYAIPGQHCLPYHNLENIKKSSFWTLVEAGIATYLEPNNPLQIESSTPLILYGFPYGVKVTPLLTPCNLAIDIAVIHSYIWMKDKGHVNADPNTNLGGWRDKLQGYDFALMGDNHTPFDATVGNCCTVNHGAFYRRHKDEVSHRPSVALLFGDLHVERYYLDVSNDKWVEESSLPTFSLDAGNFLQELEDLREEELDFREVVLSALEYRKVRSEVRDHILTAMGE